MHHLAAITGNIIIAKVVSVKTALSAVVGLALAARGREEALLALAAAAHARRVARVIDAAQIALDLAAAAWYACLVDAFMLGLLLLRSLLLSLLLLLVDYGLSEREGATTVVSAQGVLRCRRCRHLDTQDCNAVQCSAVQLPYSASVLRYAVIRSKW
jgi:hypothetical protein